MTTAAGTGVGTSKQGMQAALRAVVVDAMATGVDGTLTKNSALAERAGVGAGTVQRAVELLAEEGALETVSRGHLGRRLTALDVGACWQAARLAPVRVLLSPGGAVEMDAVESALADDLTAAGVPHTVRHRPGGTPRLMQVAAGEHDLTVVSGGTFDGARGTLPDGGLIERTLDTGTYYATDRLVVLRRAADVEAGRPVRTAGIDRSSADHEALSLAEFDGGVDFVDVPFPEVPAYVADGAVDAGIWHVTRSPVPPRAAGLTALPLGRSEARAVADGLSRATLVAWAGRPENHAVLGALGLAEVGPRQAAGFAEEREVEERRAAAARAVLADRNG
jgi:hypothetical protein